MRLREGAFFNDDLERLKGWVLLSNFNEMLWALLDPSGVAE